MDRCALAVARYGHMRDATQMSNHDGVRIRRERQRDEGTVMRHGAHGIVRSAPRCKGAGRARVPRQVVARAISEPRGANGV